MDPSLIRFGADAGYYGYALLVGEAVAPWSPAVVPVLLGTAYLGARAVANWRRLWPMAGLGLVFLGAAALGFLNGKRLGIFGPWLVLALTSLVHADPRPRRVLAALALVFGTGWIGVMHGGWWAAYRYIEPWPEVVEQALRWSEPDGAVICDHPSFFFEARYALGWEPWMQRRQKQVIEHAGRRFAELPDWQEAIAGAERVVYVRTVLPRGAFDHERALEAYLASRFELVRRRTWLEDPATELKSRFLGHAPRFRVELLLYERIRGDRAAPPA
jgi:hypothetical protein